MSALRLCVRLTDSFRRLQSAVEGKLGFSYEARQRQAVACGRIMRQLCGAFNCRCLHCLPKLTTPPLALNDSNACTNAPVTGPIVPRPQ